MIFNLLNLLFCIFQYDNFIMFLIPDSQFGINKCKDMIQIDHRIKKLIELPR
jgi:hypothetical protein